MSNKPRGLNSPRCTPIICSVVTRSRLSQLDRSMDTSDIMFRPTVCPRGQRYLPSVSGSKGPLPTVVDECSSTGGAFGFSWYHTDDLSGTFRRLSCAYFLGRSWLALACAVQAAPTTRPNSIPVMLDLFSRLRKKRLRDLNSLQSP